MPLRFTFTPHTIVGKSIETLQQYVEGDDPATGRPIMREVIDALTRPIRADEKTPEVQKPARLRFLEPDTEENLRRLFLESGCTDGLPIVLPTEERVAQMLTGTGCDPEEVIGQMTITTNQDKLEYTVEKVAINAVMAGARPEHLPVVLAVASTREPAFPSSTTSFGE